MNRYMDDLLREAFLDEVEMPEDLEWDTLRGLERRHRLGGNILAGGGMRVRPVLVALCMLVLMGSAVTAYGAANGLSVGQLFARIWGERNQNTSLEKICTEGNVLSQSSTFKDISIEPTQVVSDGYVTYILLKVEGRAGFQLTDEMIFDVFKVKDRQDGVQSLSAYVLKREGNTMYVALRSSMGSVKNYDRQKFTLDIYHLHHAVLDEMGRCSVVKNMESGKNYVRYTEESIAARGEYHAEIACALRSGKCEIPTEEFGTFEVRPLSVIVNRDIEEVGLVDVGGRDNKVYIVMEDGSSVLAQLCGGMENTSTEFELREPIDVKKVRGIRVLGNTYDIRGQKQ